MTYRTLLTCRSCLRLFPRPDGTTPDVCHICEQEQNVGKTYMCSHCGRKVVKGVHP